MIKAGKVYINIFTLPLICASILTGTVTELALSYAVAVLHELAHFAAARRLNIGASRFVIMPFGVYLQLKESVIENPRHECIVCAAGPVCNMVLIAALFLARPHIGSQYIPALDFFICTNASMLLINVVPIVPLDGGRIMRAALTHKYGFVRAAKITHIVSQINILLVGLFGVYVLYITHFNVSLMLLCAFLLFNMSTEKKNNEMTLMRQIAYSKEKLVRRKIMPVRYLAAMENVELRRVLKNFSYDSYYMVNIVDKNMKILASVSETRIITEAINSPKNTKLNVFSDKFSQPLVLSRKIC